MAEDSPLAASAYRLFSLDANGRIFGSEVIEAVDDLDAVGQARGMIGTFKVELWDRARLVARLDPETAADL